MGYTNTCTHRGGLYMYSFILSNDNENCLMIDYYPDGASMPIADSDDTAYNLITDIFKED